MKEMNRLRHTREALTSRIGKAICPIVALILSCSQFSYADTASWYSESSCKREGTSGIWTATGERFNENALTCARPNRSDFGKYFKVTNVENGKHIIVLCNDFGPNKKLVAQGRKIDLAKGAFKRISDLNDGIIQVRIEEYHV